MAEIAAEDPQAAPYAAALAADAPEIDTAWEWIWTAWHRLAAGDRGHIVRGVSMPLGATLIQSMPDFIPWTAIDRWASRYGLSAEDAALLDRCCQAMDAVFREIWLEKNKARDAE